MAFSPALISKGPWCVCFIAKRVNGARQGCFAVVCVLGGGSFGNELTAEFALGEEIQDNHFTSKISPDRAVLTARFRREGIVSQSRTLRTPLWQPIPAHVYESRGPPGINAYKNTLLRRGALSDWIR